LFASSFLEHRYDINFFFFVTGAALQSKPGVPAAPTEHRTLIPPLEIDKVAKTTRRINLLPTRARTTLGHPVPGHRNRTLESCSSPGTTIMGETLLPNQALKYVPSTPYGTNTPLLNPSVKPHRKPLV
jgi:hypothetical protein